MKTVVICGSMRFSEEIDAFAAALRRLGVHTVLTPDFGDLNKDFREMPEHKRLEVVDYRNQVPELVLRHFDRIRRADVCYLFNKNGYTGVNTTLEVGFAHAREMLIYAHEKESPTEHGGEICRAILFTEVISTPEELVERLKLVYKDDQKTSALTKQRAPKSTKGKKKHGK
jgi:hypothetical protein